MQLLDVKPHEEYSGIPETESDKEKPHYYLQPYKDQLYFEGRSAQIVLEKVDKTKIILGSMGIIHPTVLNNFDINYPVSVMEINIEPFV